MQKHPPAVWACVFLSCVLALILTGLVIGVFLLYPAPAVVTPSTTTLQPVAPPVGEEQVTVHILIPAYPPGGTCLMFLPDGDLEFVETCGCSGPPRPL